MIHVRPATVLDTARIARIHVESWRAAYRGQIPDDFLATLNEDRQAGHWRERLEKTSGELVVCELDGEVAGFCDVIPSRDSDANPQKTGEIAAIYVLAEHWRRGAGRALCSRALDTARQLEFSEVTLWVLSTNSPARQFYEFMGFRLDGAGKTERLSTGYEISEARYRKELHGGSGAGQAGPLKWRLRL